MKFSVPRSAFAAALALVVKSISTRPSGHPILSHVKLVAKGATVTLTGYDLSTGVQIPCAAQVEAAGEFTLPAAKLKEVVEKLPDCDLIFELDKEQMVLTVPQGKFRILGLPAGEYPLLPVLDSECIELSRGVLADGIKFVAGFSSDDQTKQVLTGVHITATSGTVEFAATDGHRLGVVKYAVEGDNAFELTLPSQSLRLISELFESESVRITWDNATCQFSDGDRILICRVLDGQYPQYQQLIPTQFEHRLVANRKEMVSAVDLVRIFAKNGVMRMRFDADALTFVADTPDAGGGNRTISVDCAMASPEMAFNPDYVTGPLKGFSALEIEMRWNTATSPVVMRPVGGTTTGEALYLFMPVQIRA